MTNLPRTASIMSMVRKMTNASGEEFFALRDGIQAGIESLEEDLIEAESGSARVVDFPHPTKELMDEWMREIPGGPEGWNGLTVQDLQQLYACLRSAAINLGVEPSNVACPRCHDTRYIAAEFGQQPVRCPECVSPRDVLDAIEPSHATDQQIESALARASGSAPVGARPTSTIEDALLEDCDRQRQKIHVMGEALKRSLDWLASYPGGGALNAWQQARAALSFVPPDLPLDVPPKIQCPDLLGLIGHLRYYASVDVRRGPNDSAWVTLMATVDKVLADRQPKGHRP